MPTSSRAHQTAWPRPSGSCWRVKLIWPACGRSRVELLERRRLAALASVASSSYLDVEMVLDDALVAAGDEDEMLDAGFARLVDRVLDQRPVDDRQHLLGHRLGGGQEAGAEAGDGKDGLADAGVMAIASPVRRRPVRGRRGKSDAAFFGLTDASNPVLYACTCIGVAA